VLPGANQNNSYIPQNLRKAFGLNGNRHKDAIYAYYFFRLLHRAKRIRFVYNSNTSGLRTGEMSRFLLRLKYGELAKPVFLESSFIVAPVNRFRKSIRRTGAINDIIREKFTAGGSGRGLSPSAVNTWIDCSMKFYYSYVAGIREPETLLSEVDSPLFGTILHDVMKELYEPWRGRVLERNDIENIIAGSDLIMKQVKRQLGIHFMHNPEAEIEGRNIIVAAMIHKLVNRILSVDASFAPLRILALEQRFEKTVKVDLAGEPVEMILVGTIDRIDSTGGVTRVLDYKSGSDKLEMQTAESLIAYNSSSRNSAAFQTLLYCEICYGGNLPGPLRPSLYPVREIFSDNFSDIFLIKKGDYSGLIHDYGTIRPFFTSLLDKVLSDIADPEFDFVMTDKSQKCRYCPYASVCERNVIK
jgi:CRISPR/Cas system-associated exonuclease Cas4 (RecB family)